MEKTELYIGSHVSMNAPDFFAGSVKEAISYGSNTFMFYTGAPQNTFRSPLDRCKIEEGRKLLLEHGFNEDKIVVHAPYIINLANIGNPSVYDIAKKALLSEVTEVGMVRLPVNPLQFRKAPVPMVVKEFGRIRLPVKLPVFWKAKAILPIEVTESPRTKLPVKPMQFMKA